MVVSRDCPNFWGTPYYLRNGKSYGFQIRPVYSEVHPNKSPLKILEKRERVRIQGLTIFQVAYPLLSQEREKLWISNLTTIFRGSIRIKAHEIFLGYPLLSQEREKLWISNLASTFRRSIRIKAHEKFRRKREGGRIQGLPKFFGYPLLSQEREKLRISNLASTFRGSVRTKAH